MFEMNVRKGSETYECAFKHISDSVIVVKNVTNFAFLCLYSKFCNNLYVMSNKLV